MRIRALMVLMFGWQLVENLIAYNFELLGYALVGLRSVSCRDAVGKSSIRFFSNILRNGPSPKPAACWYRIRRRL